MKLSTFIELLTQVQAVHGDIDVIVLDPGELWYLCGEPQVLVKRDDLDRDYVELS